VDVIIKRRATKTERKGGSSGNSFIWWGESKRPSLKQEEGGSVLQVGGFPFCRGRITEGYTR